jgi:hypothetical protein
MHHAHHGHFPNAVSSLLGLLREQLGLNRTGSVCEVKHALCCMPLPTTSQLYKAAPETDKGWIHRSIETFITHLSYLVGLFEFEFCNQGIARSQVKCRDLRV